MSRFQVKKISNYNAGYPENSRYKNTPVLKKIPIKLFSIFVVGFMFLLTAPGCHILFPGWWELSGDDVVDYECYEDSDCPEGKYCEWHWCREKMPDEETGDFETEDLDIVDVECVEDKDCPEYQFCDIYTGKCYAIDGGIDIMDCRYDGCWEGYECNEETGYCEPVEETDDFETDEDFDDDFDTDADFDADDDFENEDEDFTDEDITDEEMIDEE